MKLTHACILAGDIEAMRGFYERVLQLEPNTAGETYAEFRTPVGTLSLFAAAAHERLAPGSAEPGRNRSVELEFLVEDVDAEYERLCRISGLEWVKPPTTQPWGNRSIYFRDPEGNLLNFYSRIGAESGS